MKYQFEMQLTTVHMERAIRDASNAGDHSEIVSEIKCLIACKKMNGNLVGYSKDYLEGLVKFIKFIRVAPLDVDPEDIEKILKTITRLEEEIIDSKKFYCYDGLEKLEYLCATVDNVKEANEFVIYHDNGVLKIDDDGKRLVFWSYNKPFYYVSGETYVVEGIEHPLTLKEFQDRYSLKAEADPDSAPNPNATSDGDRTHRRKS